MYFFVFIIFVVVGVSRPLEIIITISVHTITSMCQQDACKRFMRLEEHEQADCLPEDGAL